MVTLTLFIPCDFYINPLTPKDLTVNSPLYLLHISLQNSYKNLVLDQDNDLNLDGLSILITCLLDNVWILEGEIECEPFLGVKGLILNNL